MVQVRSGQVMLCYEPITIGRDAVMCACIRAVLVLRAATNRSAKGSCADHNTLALKNCSDCAADGGGGKGGRKGGRNVRFYR